MQCYFRLSLHGHWHTLGTFISTVDVHTDRTCLMGTMRNLGFYVLCRVRCNLAGH